MNEDQLFQIVSPYFCAAIVSSDKKIIVKAAPIIKYMIGWSEERVEKYCEKKKWKILMIW